jgi:hypothetical protein
MKGTVYRDMAYVGPPAPLPVLIPGLQNHVVDLDESDMGVLL